MTEYIMNLDKALYDPDTGAAVFKPEFRGELVRCRDCRYGKPYIHIKDYVSCEAGCEPIDRDIDFFCADGKRRE